MAAKRQGSYEKINYATRPAKNIERKMLSEAFQRLTTIAPINTYQYIGFGSTYFTDFILFHKLLGITDMVDIEFEEDEIKQRRFKFNCPFLCIDIKFGHSGEVLPSLDWNKETILWLDYDFYLDASVLADIKHACAFAMPGSIITISVNVNSTEDDGLDDASGKRLNTFKTRVGKGKVPLDITEKDLRTWEFARTCRRIIHNEILQTISDRNGGLTHTNQLQYKQLFNFHYRDGARMLTVGGLVYANSQSDAVTRCRFDLLDFIRSGDDAYLIDVPNLTYREIRYIDGQLPTSNLSSIVAHGVPEEDIKKYVAVYRYFPSFAETET